MSHLTVTLSDQALQQALVRAELEGRAVEEYVAQIVEEKLAGDDDSELALMASFSDEDVLAMADLRMSEEESRRASELLDLNREGTLDQGQRAELEQLMDAYMKGTLKKAMGLAEAVRRKLRPPLQP
jgi:hypothetical protein